MKSSSSSQRSSELRSQTSNSSYSRVLSTSTSSSFTSSSSSSSSSSGGGGAPALQTRRFHYPIPPRIRISSSASKRVAIYLVGPLDALLGILENNNEDEVTSAVLVPLKNIEKMFVETINGGYWMTVHGGNWTDPNANFIVSDDLPFYTSNKGQIKKIKSVRPSKATTMKTAGDRPVHKEILLDLKQQHPDWYIVGILYGGSEGGDIMPYLHSKMGKNMAESNTDLAVRGVGQRINIKLSAAKEAELSSNIGLGFGHHKDKITHEYKEVVHNVVVPLLRREDYTCIEKQVTPLQPAATPPTPPLMTTILEVNSSMATNLLEDEVAVGATGVVGEVAGETEASASLAAPPGLALGLPPLGYYLGLRL
jgi:hypothetical protein